MACIVHAAYIVAGAGESRPGRIQRSSTTAEIGAGDVVIAMPVRAGHQERPPGNGRRKGGENRARK